MRDKDIAVSAEHPEADVHHIMRGVARRGRHSACLRNPRASRPERGVWAPIVTTLERAIEIAASAHAGQHDKGGHPYILHPLRVMLNVATENARMAAVLHDVVEDTGVTLEQLCSEGFPRAVLDALEALTKKPGESRLEAAARARANPIAREVKLADNADNMNVDRIGALSARDVKRLQEYVEVRAFLLAGQPDES